VTAMSAVLSDHPQATVRRDGESAVETPMESERT
jgi:hypothetical protein